MSLRTFLSELFNEGRVRLGPPTPALWEHDEDAADWLMEFERQYRLELPGEPPPVSTSAAVWAASAFHRACQFLVFRDLGADIVARDLQGGPNADDPAVHYSVDLTFRFLPDLHRQARTAAAGDVLVQKLVEWANRWPLSSVGIAGAVPASIDGFIEHPCLRQLYTDRIIACRDMSRLADERVRLAVAEVLGLHRELAPEIAAVLERDAEQEPDR
jgi:MoxR-vWA-beta-propeller ternary system domain bpX4